LQEGRKFKEIFEPPRTHFSQIGNGSLRQASEKTGDSHKKSQNHRTSSVRHCLVYFP